MRFSPSKVSPCHTVVVLKARQPHLKYQQWYIRMQAGSFTHTRKEISCTEYMQSPVNFTNFMTFSAQTKRTSETLGQLNFANFSSCKNLLLLLCAPTYEHLHCRPNCHTYDIREQRMRVLTELCLDVLYRVSHVGYGSGGGIVVLEEQQHLLCRIEMLWSEIQYHRYTLKLSEHHSGISTVHY